MEFTSGIERNKIALQKAFNINLQKGNIDSDKSDSNQKTAESSDSKKEGGGRWVTVNGKHIKIQDGEIVAGNIGQNEDSKSDEAKKQALAVMNGEGEHAKLNMQERDELATSIQRKANSKNKQKEQTNPISKNPFESQYND